MAIYDTKQLSDSLSEQRQTTHSVQAMHLAILKDVYLWMCSALVISGLTALYVSVNPNILRIVFANSMSLILMFLAQLGLIWFISAKINSISSTVATILFIVYSILTGVTLSSIFLVFTHESIASVFFITAGTFGGISLYGYTTKKDLSTWGSYLIMGLIGLIIASVVNWFLNSEMLYWIVSYVGVLIFIGLTMYDTQKIKQLSYQYSGEDDETMNKVALLGAITLYLDFINLFLYLLRIFGKRK